MSWLNSAFSYADAQARVHPVWELYVSEWGNMAGADDPSGLVGVDASSLSFPPFTAAVAPALPTPGRPGLPAPAAMAIGPRSLVDRAYVVWDLQKELQLGASYDYLRRLSVGSPLHFSQTANQGPSVYALTDLAGSVVVRPYPLQAGATGFATDPPGDATLYGATYLKADGTAGTFGQSATVNRTGGGVMPPPVFVPVTWLAPLLHVVFYLTPPTLPLPTKRFPLTFKGALPMGTVARGEQLGAIIPIHGRRVVNVSVSPSYAPNTQTANIRVAVLRSVSDLEPQETTVFTAPAVATNTQVSTTLISLAADYLLVYGEPLTVGSQDGFFRVVAYD